MTTQSLGPDVVLDGSLELFRCGNLAETSAWRAEM